jgi:phosphoesterase RecJ-like protein
LHKAIYLNDPVSGLRGRSAALSGLQLFSNDRVAIVSVTRATLESAGATPADLEDLVNVPLAAASVEVSVALVAWDPGTIKTSFRSKGAVDVAKLAAKFGGGGHSRAAGARISGSLDEVRVRLLEAIQAAFG